MESPTAGRRQISPVFVIVAAITVAIIAVGGWFLSRPVPASGPVGPSPEAKAYLGNLRLSNVTLKAAENLMQQRMVYIDGSITNSGPRPITRIDVYCIFLGVDGRELYRERVPVVAQGAGTAPFLPNQTRTFELPFDHLPDEWNQALPRLVIAQIQFAQR
jgi:hypothetical protein